jgi:hypothetical protein
MEKIENERQAKRGHEDGQREVSPINNCRLRGPNESFADAVRQGEAAQDEQSRANIVAMLRRASRS